VSAECRRRGQKAAVLLLLIVLIALILMAFSLLALRHGIINSRFSLKERMVRQAQETVQDATQDMMASFNADWRRDFYDDVMYFKQDDAVLGGDHFLSNTSSKRAYYEQNTYTVKSEYRPAAGKTFNDALLRTDRRLTSVYAFRQDATRFDFILDNPLGANFVTTLWQNTPATVFVNGDLNFLGGPKTLRGYWIVKGTVTFRLNDQVMGTVRCLKAISPPPGVEICPGGVLSPPVRVVSPTEGAGLGWYEIHASTILTGVPGGTFDLDFTVAPGQVRINDLLGGISWTYPLALNNNVIVSTGVHIQLTGDIPNGVAHPIVVVCRQDSNGFGGKVTVSGNFPTYGTYSPGPFTPGPDRTQVKADGTAVVRPGAFHEVVNDAVGWEFQSVFRSISFSVLAESDLQFNPNPPAVDQTLVGYYFAAGDVTFNAPGVTKLLGTVHCQGQIANAGGALDVYADRGLAVEVPRGLPRRPELVGLETASN
jgi:hypothetical protein